MCISCGNKSSSCMSLHALVEVICLVAFIQA
jgi:hypothetical protein